MLPFLYHLPHYSKNLIYRQKYSEHVTCCMQETHPVFCLTNILCWNFSQSDHVIENRNSGRSA